MVQKSVKNHFNKGLSLDEAEIRLRERIHLLQDDRDKKLITIENEFESLIKQEKFLLETLYKVKDNEVVSKLKEVKELVEE